jgi:hypothetical protein
VVAVQIDGQWLPPGPQTPGPWHRRVARAVTLPLMVVTMRLSVAGARRLATGLLSLESAVRLARRRLLQRLVW